MEPVIGHGHRLGEALGFVVDAAGAHRVHVPPVALGLRVDLRIAVDLGGRREQVARTLGLGQAQRLVGAQRADLERRDGLLQVVDRTRRAGKVENPVHRALDVDEAGDVVLDELEGRVADQVGDVVRRPGDEVVHPDHLVPLGDEPVAEMGAQEAGGAGDEDTHSFGRRGPV